MADNLRLSDTVVTKEHLDEAVSVGCQSPGCNHDHGLAPLNFSQKCHPRTGLVVTYQFDSGVLVLSCQICRDPLVEIAVASGEDNPSTVLGDSMCDHGRPVGEMCPYCLGIG